LRTPKLSSYCFDTVHSSHSPKRMSSDQNSRGLDSSICPFQDDNGKRNDIESQPPSQVNARRISSAGVCEFCAMDNALDDSVCCLFCRNHFHVICSFLDNAGAKKYFADNPCNKTFFTHFKNIDPSKRFGNFVFVCDKCITKHEEGKASDVQTHVQTLNDRVTSMEGSLSEIKALLEKPFKSNESCIAAQRNRSCTTQNVWHNPERMKVVKSKTPAKLVIDKADTEDSLSDKDLEKIIVNCSIPVESSFEDKSGSKILVLGSSSDRDKLKARISEAFPSQIVKSPAVRLPTISVANLSTQFSHEDLENMIFSQNPDIKNQCDNGSTLTVLSVRPQRSGKRFYASLKVSQDIRDLIDQSLKNKLYVGMSRCDVYDHFHVKRCNRCQKFNHYKGQCKASAPVCANCSEDHETNSCTKAGLDGFVPSCINCKRNSCPEGHAHAATSKVCYSYIAAQENLKKAIASKNGI